MLVVENLPRWTPDHRHSAYRRLGPGTIELEVVRYVSKSEDVEVEMYAVVRMSRRGFLREVLARRELEVEVETRAFLRR